MSWAKKKYHDITSKIHKFFIQSKKHKKFCHNPLIFIFTLYNNVTFFFFVHFSLIVKPLTVEIVNKKLPLVADRRYEVQCESGGSRPNAIITWYKGKRQLRRAKVRLQKNNTFFHTAIITRKALSECKVWKGKLWPKRTR